MAEEPKISGKNKGYANLKPFKKGDKRINREGHPLGQKNYATLRREAIIKLGQLNNKTPEEINVMLISGGLGRALKGDFRYYKDDLDRTHGKPTETINLEGNLTLNSILAENLKKRNNENGNDNRPKGDSLDD